MEKIDIEELFESKVYTHPEPSEVGEQVEAHFLYKGDPDYIDYVDTSCGCSDAWYDSKENKVKAILNTALIGATKGEPQVYNKTVVVHLDPKEPTKIIDEEKRSKPNPNKPKLYLTLKGLVK